MVPESMTATLLAVFWYRYGTCTIWRLRPRAEAEATWTAGDTLFSGVSGDTVEAFLNDSLRGSVGLRTATLSRYR